MIKNTQFIQQLFKELTKWVDLEIITPLQRTKIERLYTTPNAADAPAAGKNSDINKDNMNFAKVIIGLAAFCLSVGIIIFYASNWRKMPPVLKLIQIFLVIIGLYGGAYYFLQTKRKFSIIGRALLILGIISYGAGIMLVAQIYHISSHPANGVLAWAIGAFAIAALMRDKYSLALSILLFVIWDIWEYFYFGNPNYLFIIPILLIGLFSYKIKKSNGITVSSILLIFYITQISCYWIELYSGSNDYAAYLIVMLQFIFAPFLITYGKIMAGHDLFKNGGRIFNIAGWFLLLLLLFILSWPMNLKDMPSFINIGFPKCYSIEYIILSAASLAGLFFLRKRKKSIIFAAPVLFLGLLVFFLPFNHTPTRMITLHLAAVGFIFLLLYYSYLFLEGKSFEKIFAFIFTISLITVKGFGFIILAYNEEHFKLAYLIGFILFTIVCFLLNRLADKMLTNRGKNFPVNILDIICAIVVWLSVYLASFKVDEQKSIFEAEPVVVQMTAIFIALSFILYFILLKMIKENRIILYLSLIIFISSGVILLTAGPNIPWVIYSVTFNLLLFIISAVYMYYSSIIKSKNLLDFAAIAIAIHIFTRYFDLFWDMFSGSLLFIITGIIGLAGGYLLEKKRSDISKNIKTSIEDKLEEKI